MHVQMASTTKPDTILSSVTDQKDDGDAPLQTSFIGGDFMLLRAPPKIVIEDARPIFVYLESSMSQRFL